MSGKSLKALHYRAFFCWIEKSSQFPIESLEQRGFTAICVSRREQLGRECLRLNPDWTDQELWSELQKLRHRGKNVVLWLAKDLLKEDRERILQKVPRVLHFSAEGIENFSGDEFRIDTEQMQWWSKGSKVWETRGEFASEYVNYWLEFIWHKANPAPKWTHIFRWSLYILALIPFYLIYLNLEKMQITTKYSATEEEAEVESDSCLWRGKASNSEIRRIVQASYFDAGFFMLKDEQVFEILKKYKVDSLNQNDTKKRSLCVQAPKIHDRYPLKEYQAYRFWKTLIRDSLAYPTDYFWDGAESLHRKHLGIDFGAAFGSVLESPFAGRAKVVESGPGGRMIGVESGRFSVYFAHCDRYLVFPGDSVSLGEPIATVGMTGRTTGPHAHIGTGIKDESGEIKWINPVDWYYEYKENEKK